MVMWLVCGLCPSWQSATIDFLLSVFFLLLTFSFYFFFSTLLLCILETKKDENTDRSLQDPIFSVNASSAVSGLCFLHRRHQEVMSETN